MDGKRTVDGWGEDGGRRKERGLAGACGGRGRGASVAGRKRTLVACVFLAFLLIVDVIVTVRRPLVPITSSCHNICFLWYFILIPLETPKVGGGGSITDTQQIQYIAITSAVPVPTCICRSKQ